MGRRSARASTTSSCTSFRSSKRTSASRCIGKPIAPSPGPRVIRLDQADAIAHWSEVTNCLEAYRLSMMELHASAAFALNENSRRHRIRTRVDANARAA
ncbi:MAG: hypothetical protein ACOYMK_17945 [Hyphomonadaceae bacterium]